VHQKKISIWAPKKIKNSFSAFEFLFADNLEVDYKRVQILYVKSYFQVLTTLFQFGKK